ncbi:MAG: peptide transporter substrate-binding protein, partial [Rhodospirillales bacterium]|nr:peptide transporter substrate-binding protein [Rhodospirillales bacterium]
MNRIARCRLTLAALLVAGGAGLFVGSVAAAQTAPAPATLNVVANLTTGWVRNFNPFNETTRLHSVREFVYEPLVIFNAMHNGQPHFRLATNFDFSPNLLKLTFTLRDDVKWSDGQSFTSKDVAFTFEL